MGADQKSFLKKCGEILINIKTKNKKTKIYTFNCAYCDINCDQLKKFSLHLEEQHTQQISENGFNKDTTVIYEPEIKTEELQNVDDEKDDLHKSECFPLHEDPLEAIEPGKEIGTTNVLLDLQMKKQEQKQHNPEMDYEDNDSNGDDMDYHNSLEDNTNSSTDSDNGSTGSEYNKKVNTNLSNLRNRKKETKSDKCEKKKGIKFKRKDDSSVQTNKKRLKKSEDNAQDIDDKELSIALLKAFEKQTKLWKIKERVIYNKDIQKYFEIVANEVNEKLKSNLTWETAKFRIRKLRNNYSKEMQKKNKGADYELPWYSEHMQFLQENVQLLLKGRQLGEKYKALKSMDESELSLLIDAFKKYDSLWQINNIGFGSMRKKEQEFGKIAEELNLSHNFNLTADTLHPRVNYMLRIYSENKKLQLECELEKSEFKPSTPLYEKMSFLSDGYGPFRCSQCNEIIDKFGDYREHEAKHNGIVPFACSLCKKTFDKYKYYVVHARNHLELNHHFCKYCDKGYPSTTQLRLHERSHTGENPYLCQICGATFRAPNSYDNHIRRHENRFRYVCHICNHGFNHVHAYNDHVKAHLNIRDLVCNICGKSFSAPKRLKNHQDIHAEHKRFKCKDCGKAFAQNAGLRQHRKQHQPFAAQRKKDPCLNFDNVDIDLFKK